MSMSSPIQGIRIPNPSPTSCSSSSPSSSSSSSPCSFRISSSKPFPLTIRSSQTEGPLRRPVAPPVREQPSSLQPPLKPVSPSPPQPLRLAAAVAVGDDKNLMSMEFQRQKAKELQNYFKQKKFEESNQGPLVLVIWVSLILLYLCKITIKVFA